MPMSVSLRETGPFQIHSGSQIAHAGFAAIIRHVSSQPILLSSWLSDRACLLRCLDGRALPDLRRPGLFWCRSLRCSRIRCSACAPLAAPPSLLLPPHLPLSPMFPPQSPACASCIKPPLCKVVHIQTANSSRKVLMQTCKTALGLSLTGSSTQNCSKQQLQQQLLYRTQTAVVEAWGRLALLLST